MTAARRQEILAKYGMLMRPLTAAESVRLAGVDLAWERDTAAKAEPAVEAPVVAAQPAPAPVVVRPLFGDVGTLALDRDTEAA